MIKFSQSEVNAMATLNLGLSTNKESRILLFGSLFSRKILKKFYIDNGPKFEDKIIVINNLIKNRDKFDSRFILPQELAFVDGRTVGYVMDFVESKNLETLLNSNSVSNFQKILLLKEVGLLLEQCKKLRQKYKELSQFYIGDLHEGNFIYNKKTDRLNIVDLDGCRLQSSNPCIVKYLDTSKEIKELTKKYPRINDSVYIPNENSDIYCYIMMILNYLYQGNVQELSKSEYLNYLDYIYNLGIKQSLVDIFSKVYQEGNNENPFYLLETINDFIVPYLNKMEYNKAYVKK